MELPLSPFFPHLKTYFETTTQDPAATEWRLKTFKYGDDKANYIEQHHFPLKGARVLDAACGWGGHALAFARRGATVTASDLNDHAYEALRAFCGAQQLPMDVHLADCQHLPFKGPYDVVLALDLIEHIPDPIRLAGEIERLLAPGGICILTTPAKLPNIFLGEPHWGLRGLSALPFSWQRPIAQNLFGRTYPFPIERQYWHARQVQRLFSSAVECQPVGRHPAIVDLAWRFFVIKKP